MKLDGFRFVALALCMGPSSAAHVEGILEQHNVYRCMHNADPVIYSTALEADAQSYADTLAGACGDLTPDMTLDDTTEENLSLCLLVADPEDACSSGSVAVPRWYGEVTSYAEDGSGTGTSTNPSQSIDQFTQLVWKSTTQIGCASSTCDISSNLPVTYVVCRYQVAGNVATQYGANVEGTASRTFEDCAANVGGPSFLQMT
ncbi:unnamed protein product [Ascophyllum nodosum]